MKIQIQLQTIQNANFHLSAIPEKYLYLPATEIQNIQQTNTK